MAGTDQLEKGRRTRSEAGMLEVSKKKTNIGVGIGLALQIGGRVMIGQGDSMATLGLVILLAGLVVFTWGCCMYIEGKGYHPVVGVLGLFSLIGLLILAGLHDQHPENAAARSAAEPRPAAR